MTIRLKCWPESWSALAMGLKTCEIRSAEDRTFAVGDVLELEKWDPRTRQPLKGVIRAEITHIDAMAGDVNLLGIRLHSHPHGGEVIRLVVLSLNVLGVAV